MTHATDREAIPEPQNPLGVDGIEFIEFATSRPQALGGVLETFGFRPIARHRSREVELYRQGTMNIIVNAQPADVPRTKAEKTRAFGAEVLFYDRQREDRVAIAKRLMQERGLVMVPPFEDRWVMAGAGTVALETVQQAAAMGAPLDAMIACCSGGGLAAGERRCPGGARTFRWQCPRS